MKYLNRRPRRNRSHPVIRNLTEETIITKNDLIFPLFLMDGSQSKVPVDSMPGIYRFSLDMICKEIEECLKLGIHAFVIFPVVEKYDKDSIASKGYDSTFFYLTCLKEIKQKFPETFIITDVAMDPYSSDGHDGVVKNGKILNDDTLKILKKMALTQAETGVDMLGTSDMMDGRVGYLREALDSNGFTQTGIMSYTAKYASAFYGPFREALGSTPKLGDKKTYQMNPANKREAILEGQLDVEEGADILMVKPALSYLDIIHLMKTHFNLPIAAYNVSGEYAMIKAASQKGWIDEKQCMNECLLSIKRAGADIILTYFAKSFAKQ